MEREDNLAACFSELEDPRIERCKRHELTTIVMLAICAVICSADSWTEIEDWAKAKEGILKEFLDLPNGIPSHDTFARVFSRLDPKKFQECFGKWLQSLRLVPAGEVIAIDGKTLRGSYNRAVSQSPLHCVSAWATSRNVALGQVVVDDKSNEITAIPRLLDLLEISGCVVTIDAMGCQRNIASKIREGKADYVLTLKKNHPDLYDDVETFFAAEQSNDFKECAHTFSETTDKEHGRVEVRRCWSTDDISWLGREEDWKDLRSISMITRVRSLIDPASSNMTSTTETAFYLSSLPADAAKLSKAVRQHWAIENSLHWILDVTFNEDKSRIRKGRAPQNFSTLRKIAISLLKNSAHKRKSVRGRRKIASWDERFFLNVVFGKQ